MIEIETKTRREEKIMKKKKKKFVKRQRDSLNSRQKNLIGKAGSRKRRRFLLSIMQYTEQNLWDEHLTLFQFSNIDYFHKIFDFEGSPSKLSNLPVTLSDSDSDEEDEEEGEEDEDDVEIEEFNKKKIVFLNLYNEHLNIYYDEDDLAACQSTLQDLKDLKDLKGEEKKKKKVQPVAKGDKPTGVCRFESLPSNMQSILRKKYFFNFIANLENLFLSELCPLFGLTPGMTLSSNLYSPLALVLHRDLPLEEPDIKWSIGIELDNSQARLLAYSIGAFYGLSTSCKIRDTSSVTFTAKIVIFSITVGVPLIIPIPTLTAFLLL